MFSLSFSPPLFPWGIWVWWWMAFQVARWYRICLPMQETWDAGSIPGEGNGNPLQYSYLGNPMDRGAWSTIVHGVKKSQAQPSDSTTREWNSFCLWLRPTWSMYWLILVPMLSSTCFYTVSDFVSLQWILISCILLFSGVPITIWGFQMVQEGRLRSLWATLRAVGNG